LESGEKRSVIDNDKAVRDAIEHAKAVEDENEILSDVMDEIHMKMSAAVDMQQLAESVIIEITDEGLRIQITDRDKISMFPVGSTGMTPAANEIIKAIGEAVVDVPNKIAITGHTDSLGYKDNASFDNWDLSSGRANSARRILVGAGVNMDRISRVEGLADRDLLVKNEPNDPRNRRISVTLLRKN
jgi:chemotaxis protein MotB